jgi:hypothetical protein
MQISVSEQDALDSGKKKHFDVMANKWAGYIIDEHY